MKQWQVLVAAIGVGIVNAVVYKLFEFVVDDGSNLIWNDWLQTDTHRWLVIPVAIGLGVLFSLVLRLLSKPRWTKPETNLAFDAAGGKTTLASIGTILGVGGAGLLAGASLGPEMPLTESSRAIGQWTSGKLRLRPQVAALLVAASIGALMVAFLGSLIMILLPFLLIYKKAKRIPPAAILPIVLAGVSAYGALWLMDHQTAGYGSIPAAPHAGLHDYAAAIVVALCISMAALVLVRLVGWLGHYTGRIDKRLPWIASAAIFGLLLGTVYLLGGQSIEFSGSAGSHLLLSHKAAYGTWALLGIALAKLAATAWSKASGYRGGLFFPSIFVGIAIGLFVEALEPALSGPGAMVGAIAAIFVALSIPDKPSLARQDYIGAAAGAFLIIAALLPAKLIPLALLAILSALAGNKLLVRFFPAKLQPV